MTTGHCTACGRALGAADHAACTPLLALDPPRYCGVCGFRLDVQVFPDGYRSACRECRRRARPPGLSRPSARGADGDDKPRR